VRVLLIHADRFQYEVRGKALKEPEKAEGREALSVGEALIAFCSVEKGDEKNPEQVVDKTAESIREQARRLKVNLVVVYPYAHLAQDLASPKAAAELLRRLESKLQEAGYPVKRAPFGWYKSFELKCKGHPLSELSRTISPEEAEEERPEAEYIYKVLTPSMELYAPEDYGFKPGEENFKALVEKEALKKELAGGGEPRYLSYCKKFGLDWESFSDLGHMRFGPEATFLFEMVSDYADRVSCSLGIPVYKVRGTNMFDLSVPPVREHAQLFGGRLYQLKSGGRDLLLRYAACHQQFAMIRNWTISYKDLPMGAYELADSYRLEQEGELLLCFRLRKLHMPDLHVFCRDMREAQEYALKIHRRIYEEVEKLGLDYVSLYNVTEEFFEGNRDFFRELLSVEGKPVLLCFVPGKYYWVLNVEYNIIDELGRPREIATFQIDVGNAQRFGITYVNEEGAKVYPVIIHSALLGSVERYLYAVFDSAVKAQTAGKPPQLPLWLSPTQVRVIPVSRTYLDLSMEVVEWLERENIRADLDDGDETLPRKVRKAETAWVPYTLVVGEEEAASRIFSVRARGEKPLKKMSLEELAAEIKEKVKGYPWRPLPVPKRLSVRPVY
jgi:threonyl-tRNA synthetase